MDKIENALIEKVYLGNNDYGYMSYWLGIKKESGSCTSFGTHDLRFYGIELINRILEVTGVGQWDSLEDTMIRIKIDKDGQTIDIGHIMKDDWLNLDLLAKRIRRLNKKNGT